MANTKIEWATKSWNPWTGCVPISEGCQHCYAKRLAETRLRGRCGYPKDEPFELQFHPDRLEEPLHWRRGQRVFVCSMGDIGHPDIAWADFLEVMRVIKRASQHTFLFLTKRPDVLLERFQLLGGVHPEMKTLARADHLFMLPNLWVGVSVENQRRADERIPMLLDIPAGGHFVSVEPMLGVVDIRKYLVDPLDKTIITKSLDWVIVGAETGPGARPTPGYWIHNLRSQCNEMSVPFFGKKDSAGDPILPRLFPQELRQEVAL